MERWRLLTERPGPNGYLTVTTRTYELANGRRVEWDILTGGDSVAVLALTPDRRVVLVRQYRPGPERILDELPGGGVEPGEAPEAAGARELREETGYAGRVELVGSTWLAGNVQRRRWAALALDCVPVGAPAPDDGEDCETVLMTLGEFRAHLRSGQLTDADIGYLALDHAGLLGVSA